MIGSGGRRTATDFEPSTDVFPSIAVKPIAKSLRLEQRGRADGKKDYPAPGATGLTTAEEEAITEIVRLRKRGIDAFDRHFSAYAGRIELGASALHQIETQAGKLQNEMVSESRTQRNNATNCLRDVQDSWHGLKAYQERHRLTQPPEDAGSGIVLWFFVVVFLGIEIALGSLFFVEHSPGGILGSAAYALMIALINVVLSGMLGLGARYAWLRGVGHKLLGIGSMLLFPVLLLGFNLFVGHFRRATDEMVWEEAGTAMFESFRSDPFNLGSFNAILIAGFGLLVAICAFIKFLRIKDIHPGYNKAYDRVHDAIEDFAEAYEEAETHLNELFDKSREALSAEALQLRAQVRDATSAHSAQATLLANLDAFLAESEQVANGLLRSYREANERARSTHPPEYFRTRHAFSEQPRKDVTPLGITRIEDELERINAAASKGVSEILAARKRELGSLPTTDELLDGLTRGKPPDRLAEPAFQPVIGGRR